jgi:hypothetical protein
MRKNVETLNWIAKQNIVVRYNILFGDIVRNEHQKYFFVKSTIPSCEVSYQSFCGRDCYLSHLDACATSHLAY